MLRTVTGWLAFLIGAAPLAADPLAVKIDHDAATRVLAALAKPDLDEGEALAIARLPGNQGLIRKSQSYGRAANDESFAKALIAAAHHDDAAPDPSRFRFPPVRDRMGRTAPVIAAFDDPKLMDGVRARIAAFTPPGLAGSVTGYLVVGGTSGGFAFGDPVFYLDIDRFPSAPLAATIMQHELFHAVQAIARPEAVAKRSEACLAKIPHAKDMADFLDPLEMEGTASLVGDMLAIPEKGADAPSTEERARFARNVSMVDRSITQLELSVHGLATGAQVTPEAIYALGFYGDEVLYALGYVMAKAIAKERGEEGIVDVIRGSGAAFVLGYAALRTYGKDEATPALRPETLQWARTVAACDPRP